ncbi:MAG: endonuclease, partial [Candidatus Colwellbacteria bacterium CG10_big_fil_rev_8_21_14_0_10_42_22]
TPSIRLKEHNEGTNKWTRQNKPFELLYSESYKTNHEARKRESFLKSGQGRKWLDEHVK